MKQKIELSDIFAKTEIQKEEEYERKRIRRLLFAGICSECGGKLRYRPSFDPNEWLVSFCVGWTLRICICKSCGTKKKLTINN